ncbi:MAG TPA: hypothetical protein VNO26_10650 [Candidatus Limnocylindria bacterium]|nr:hypothetical protein [Candidatus Limnocylindria bacterium]
MTRAPDLVGDVQAAGLRPDELPALARECAEAVVAVISRSMSKPPRR